MDKNISYRRAEVGDIERIKEILFGSLKEYQIAIPDNYSVSDIDNLHTDDYRGEVFVLLRKNIVVGFIVLRPTSKDCIELKRLYLTSSERGKRLGQFLLKQAINYAEKNDYKSIRLETSSKFNEAVSLYSKHGFFELLEVEKAPGHDLALEKIIGKII